MRILAHMPRAASRRPRRSRPRTPASGHRDARRVVIALGVWTVQNARQPGTWQHVFATREGLIAASPRAGRSSGRLEVRRAAAPARARAHGRGALPAIGRSGPRPRRPVSDSEALDAFKLLSQLEGIIPALESAHAVAQAIKVAAEMDREQLIVVNLSGRGDKDVNSVKESLGRKVGPN